MDERRQRALLLFQQGRHELCERELGQILAAHPRDAWAHATLAHCLITRGKLDAAEASVRAALEEAPESDYAHQTLARLFIARGQLTDARAAVLEAVRLDPDYPGHRALFGVIELDLGNPAEALRAADEALALDPRHKESLNLRAKALIALGRSQDARQVVEQSLAVDPQHGDTHETMGAALLQAGDAEGAVACYREALRLDPNSAIARAGFLQALKAGNPLYRWLLKSVVWTGREKTAVRIGVVVSFISGKNLLMRLTDGGPSVWPIVVVVVGVLLALIFLVTWFADWLFNLLVRSDPLGRHMLTPRHRAASNYLVAFTLVVVTAATSIAIWPGAPATPYVAVGSLIALPVSLLISYPRGSQRRRLGVYTGVLTAVGLAAAAAAALELGGASGEGALPPAVLFGLGCVVSIGIGGRRDPGNATG